MSDRDPIRDRERRRQTQVVQGASNKTVDARPQQELFGSRQVGVVTERYDPARDIEKKRRQEREVNPAKRLVTTEQHAPSPTQVEEVSPPAPKTKPATTPSGQPSVQHADAPYSYSHESTRRSPLGAGGRVLLFLVGLGGWTWGWSGLVPVVLMPPADFSPLSSTYWEQVYKIVAGGWIMQSQYMDYVGWPLLGWVIGGFICGGLAVWLVPKLAKALSSLSSPFSGMVENTRALWAAWKKRSRPQPRSLGGSMQPPTTHQPTTRDPKMDSDRVQQEAMERLKRAEAFEEEKKKAEEEDPDGLSGAGGSVSGGGLSPNVIAAKMSSRGSGGNG